MKAGNRILVAIICVVILAAVAISGCLEEPSIDEGTRRTCQIAGIEVRNNPDYVQTLKRSNAEDENHTLAISAISLDEESSAILTISFWSRPEVEWNPDFNTKDTGNVAVAILNSTENPDKLAYVDIWTKEVTAVRGKLDFFSFAIAGITVGDLDSDNDDGAYYFVVWHGDNDYVLKVVIEP